MKALIVTPPDTNEEARFEYDAAPLSSKPATLTPGATVGLRHKANGFAVTLEHFEADYLLVCGTANIRSVTVNGSNLPNVPETKLASTQSGWLADPALNRIIVRLSPNESRMEIEIKF